MKFHALGRATVITLALLFSSSGKAALAADDALHLTLITDQIHRPVYAIAPPGDHERVFVPEQYGDDPTGWIWLIKNGALVPEPFLTIGPVATQNATGVLCLAFDPAYGANGTFYVLHTDEAGDVIVTLYKVSADPDRADPRSGQVVLTIPQPHHFHNGGWMGFGPDGYLYVSSGDGGPSEDPDQQGQDTSVLLGKMLRLDVHGDDFPDDPLRNYAIPPDNPFVGGPGRDEIWALGLREPWRCSFDRATGDFYIADVGQEGWEELDVEPAGSAGGLNYGWRCREGAHDFLLDPECAGVTFTDPLYEYAYAGAPSRCCIIGGYVYRGTVIPELQGRYLFSDYCTSEIWSFRLEDGRLTDFREHCVETAPAVDLERITSFGEDACGELYVTTRFDQVFKIVGDAPIDDCNENDVEDGCEISLGLSADVNANGIPDACECLADLDGSDDVDFGDLLLLLGRWGVCAPEIICPGDIDGSGTIDFGDLTQLLIAWGPCA